MSRSTDRDPWSLGSKGDDGRTTGRLYIERRGTMGVGDSFGHYSAPVVDLYENRLTEQRLDKCTSPDGFIKNGFTKNVYFSR